MKHRYRLFIIFSLFVLFTQAYASTKNSCRPPDNKKIESAVKYFLDTNQTISYNEIVIISKQCSKDYARAIIHPKQPTTDDGTLYLKKTNGHWHVIKYGTDFDATFLATIPKALKE